MKENHPGQQTLEIVTGAEKSEVRIADGSLHVKMRWACEAHIPVASITRADVTEERAFTPGVHYLSGRWLVNGSGTGLVTLTTEPPVKAKAAFRSVNLRSLVVSVSDPD